MHAAAAAAAHKLWGKWGPETSHMVADASVIAGRPPSMRCLGCSYAYDTACENGEISALHWPPFAPCTRATWMWPSNLEVPISRIEFAKDHFGNYCIRRRCDWQCVFRKWLIVICNNIVYTITLLHYGWPPERKLPNEQLTNPNSDQSKMCVRVCGGERKPEGKAQNHIRLPIRHTRIEMAHLQSSNDIRDRRRKETISTSDKR